MKELESLKAKQTRIWIAVIIMATALILTIVLGIRDFLTDIYVSEHYNSDVNGIITDRENSRVYVNYTINQQEYTYEFNTNLKLTYLKGDSVKLKYNHLNPNEAALKAKKFNGMYIVFYLTLGILLFVFSFLLHLSYKDISILENTYNI